MKIWVDADACPIVIKEILYRVAIRRKCMVIFVSNHVISTPITPFIKKIQVEKGFDIADNKIVASLASGDLIITADIPLADQVVAKNCLALNPRGELYTQKNIKECLAMRNFSTDLRGSGIRTRGPSVLKKNQIERFANQLDKLITQYCQQSNKGSGRKEIT